MSLRVVHWGTGTVGLHGLRQVISHPELELVGLWVHSPHKKGRDVGEIAGVEPVGVLATNEIDELLGLSADCVVHMGHNPDIQPPGPGTNSARALEEICTFLEAGTNVVSTTLTPLVWPHAWGPEALDRLRAATAKGETTYQNVGIHPGFMCDGLVLALTANMDRVSEARCEQVLNYSAYDEPERLRLLGFGMPAEAVKQAYTPGLFLNSYRCTIEMIADGLGVSLDDVVEEVDFMASDFDVKLPSMTVGAGTIGAFRFTVSGVIDGKKLIVLDHATRLDDRLAPGWPDLAGAGGFRATVGGRPSMRMTVELGIDGTGPVVEACRATAALATNAVVSVCSAPPGVSSVLDVAPTPAKGLFVTP